MSSQLDGLAQFEALPFETRQRVSAICDSYEAALQRGEEPGIEEYLREFRDSEAGKDVLLRELLILKSEGPLGSQESLADTPRAKEVAGQPGPISELVALAHHYLNEANPSQSRPVAEAPTKIGTYRLIRELGRGGFGTVFLASHCVTGHEVALKIPHPAVLLTPGLRDWFIRETAVAATLNHPRIVKFIESGDAGLVCYLATEFIPGPSLATWFADRGKPVEPLLAARMLVALAEAVHYAHTRGVLHRDLKPANVLLENGDPLAPRLTDFGLARLADVTDLSQTGLIVGSPSYMSPEQAKGQRQAITARTDLFALGAILYELLTGSPPFTGQLSFEVLHNVISAEPRRPRRINRSIPRALETICLTCLEKDPDRRYPSAAALAKDLELFLIRKPVVARSVGVVGRLARWRQREPLVARLASSLLLVLLLAIAGLTLLWRQAEEQARQTHLAKIDAETHLELTRTVTADLLRITRSSQLQSAGVRDLALVALTRAETSHRQHLLNDTSNATINATLADIYLTMGNLHWSAGQEDPAKHYLERSITQWEHLIAKESPRTEYRSGLAQAHLLLARALEEFDQPQEAINSARQAHALRQSLLEETPNEEARIARAITAHHLGEVLRRMGLFAESRDVLEDNLRFLAGQSHEEHRQIRDYVLLRARTTHALAELHSALGQDREGQEWWRKARGAWKESIALASDRESELQLAQCCLEVGNAQPTKTDALEALALLKTICRHDLDRLREAPTEPLSARQAFQSYVILATCYHQLGNFQIGIAENQYYLDTLEKLLQAQKFNQELNNCLVRGLCNISAMQADAGDRESSAAAARKAAAILLHTQLPLQAGKEIQYVYLSNICYLVHRLRLVGTMEEANQLAAKALREATQLVEDAPEKAYRWVLLSDAWLQITKNSWHRNLLPETIAAYRQLLSSLRRAVELAPGCYRYKRQLAERTIRFGRCLREFGSFDEAESCFLAPLHACPSDPLLLHQAAHEMSELAREIASRHSPLATARQEQYQRCLEQSRVLTETALNLQKSEKPHTSGK